MRAAEHWTGCSESVDSPLLEAVNIELETAWTTCSNLACSDPGTWNRWLSEESLT